MGNETLLEERQLMVESVAAGGSPDFVVNGRGRPGSVCGAREAPLGWTRVYRRRISERLSVG